MSQKVSQIEDDAQDLQYASARRNLSSLSTYNLPKTQQQKKSKGLHTIYVLVILVLLFTLIYVYKRSPQSGKNNLEIDSKMKQLSDVVKQLQGQQNANVRVINDLKKQVQKFEVEEKKHHQTGKVQPAKPSQQQAVQQKPVVLKNSQDGKTGNMDKGSYMTPELEKISEKRRQKGGMKKVAGTVSEISYDYKNQQGKKVEQILYDEGTREGRKRFQDQRVEFLSGKKNFQSLYLVSFNNKLNENRNEEQYKVEAEQYAKIDRQWNFSKYREQIPMCVVVPGYNNNAKFRIEYNLNSIFQQNYTNYFVVIMNDASTDNSDYIYRKYLDFYKIDPEKYAYVQNTQRKTALQNIYIASHEYCSPDSVVINLDADDEFIGKNVLKVFNAGYQKHKAGVVYSNFYWYDQGANIMLGFTSEYTENDKKNRGYRQAPQRFSHLRSYKTELFLQIKEKDFKDENGKFWTSAYDMVMYFPLMELSCGRVNKIQGFHYLYNINTGLNDYAVDRNKQVTIDNKVRHGAKYECYKVFDDKMNA